MKTNLIVLMIATIFGFISCTDNNEGMTAKSETVTFSILTEPVMSTRAAAPIVTSKDARYIVEVWNADSTARLQRIVQLNKTSFSLILDKSVSYTIAVWVDYVNDVDDATGTPTDYYYTTSDFKSIELNTTDHNPDAFDSRVYKSSLQSARDAFTGVFPFPAGQPYPTSLQVKRPFARINVIATDAGLWKSRAEVNGDSIKFRITNPGYYSYNILTQKPTATGVNVEFTNTIAASTYNAYPDGVNQIVVSGLYFAHPNTTDYVLNTKKFVIHTQIGNQPERLDSITSLPFKRNFNTNITGGLIFNTASFDIDASTPYDDPDVDYPL